MNYHTTDWKVSEKTLRRIFETMPAPMVVLSWPELCVLQAGERFCRFAGLACSSMAGVPFFEHSIWVDPAEAEGCRKRLWLEHSVEGMEARFRQADGLEKTVELSALVVQQGAGSVVTVVVRDIDRFKMAEVERHESEERYKRIVNNIQDVYFECSMGGTLVEITPSVLQLTGYLRQEVVGQSLTMVLFGREQFCELKRQIQEQPSIKDGEMTVVRKDGGTRVCSLYANLMTGGSGNPLKIIGSLRDITRRKLAHEEITQLAYNDSLTGLANRMLLHDRIRMALVQAERDRTFVSLLFLDLDRFKNINDTLGHDVGDELLKIVAGRIQGCVRRNDTVARLGGDEFVVLLNSVRHSEEAVLVAEKILHALREPCRINKTEVHIASSIGIALSSSDGDDVNTLLKNADLAMYAAKEQGRGTFQFYSDRLNKKARERFEMESAMRQALKNEDFFLVYQPQCRTDTAAVLGVEALLRWRHPEKGMVSPALFIPLAEDLGLIHDIGAWVLEQACAQLRQWQDKGVAVDKVAVNISGRQLREPDFIEQVNQILQRTGLPARCLELEMTESVLMDDVNSTVKILARLKALGISLAVDDFGTGYSSLNYLQHFPIDRIKIDRGFIQAISADTNNSAIVDAIIAMATTLGLKVVAEGVETREQLLFLHGKKCDEVQGFHFERPLSPAALEAWIHGCPPHS